jgi:enhancing lycopene biosynthesis protein 2
VAAFNAAPVLDIVQENAPYVVFVLVYLVSFFGVANGAWGIAKLVSVILDKNKKEAEK